jgi:hypothetical protein
MFVQHPPEIKVSAIIKKMGVNHCSCAEANSLLIPGIAAESTAVQKALKSSPQGDEGTPPVSDSPADPDRRTGISWLRVKKEKGWEHRQTRRISIRCNLKL